MNGRPHDTMSVGIIHFMAFPEAMAPGGPVVETIEKLCADPYFDALEVTAIADADARRRAIAAVQKAGKRVAFGAQPVLLGRKLNLNALDPAERQKALDAARACIQEAAEWKAESVTVLSGPVPAPEQLPMARAMLVASLKELCEFGRRTGGMPIRLETFDRVTFGKNCLVGPTAEAVEIADKIAPYYPSFGLALDLSHLPLLGETSDHAIRTAGADLKHVHIGNCVMRDAAHAAYGDNHPLFGCEGGENDVPQLVAFLKVLLETGYIAPGKRNIVSFEIKPGPGQSGDDVIANAKKTLDAAWKEL